ncbi:MAG: ABC-type branched-chain amino acid transport system, ATPase component [Verrucomicrobiaceae bacterium]|nr:ABC-type branched-chain amino acid transport system, ATPase component [Verrucomicrobiaceae bacterium]
MLDIKNVTQLYGGTQILWDLSMNITAGSRTCIMGRNGVGKTTLLKCIMGLLPVRSGSIQLEANTITGKPAELRPRIGIGYVPQGREIFPQLTVEENLMIGLGARRDKVRKIPERIYELFPVLKQMRRRRGGDLSGGQQQQLAIGRALVLEPTLLILDEPNEGIQPNIVAEIGDILLRLNREEKLTIILVEQKLAFARRIGEHFFLMEKGRVVANGEMANLNADLISRHLAV